MKNSNSSFQITHFYNYLSRELQKELPGSAAQAIMSPSVRDYSMKKADPSTALNSGVLLLLYPKEGQIYICLIKRSKGNHNHSGQMSLPGGKYEQADISLINTALRETEEELGVAAREVKILGCLSQLYIPVSNFYVLPVVGIMKKQPHFTPNPFEVDQLIEVPLSQLFNPSNIRKDEILRDNLKIRVPYFDALGNKVWGATAMILSELNVILKSSDHINL